MTPKGSYVLVVRLERTLEIQVGKLGLLNFPRGYYLYFGSALNGLEGRIQRHRRREKILRWHIDYLTSLAPVAEVWRIEDDARWECAWAQIAIDHDGVLAPAKGFGSSDCRCQTHLVFLTSRTRVNGLRRLLRENVETVKCGLDIQRTVL
ncbi:MAG: GIY-YIG nuclease family protein [Chloroflexi bacterium]|nr:GIY-YIG nuclease family protein [Chloroflexota bacterium]MDA1227169.1 GIY-YIG nuclease family protein [Chloroflexota bacterium]